MRCANCGSENADGTKFCRDCGTALAQRCPRCGAPNPPGSRFCGECGVRLAGAPVGDRKSTRLNSSHGYISYAVFCLKKKKKKIKTLPILNKKKKKTSI